MPPPSLVPTNPGTNNIVKRPVSRVPPSRRDQIFLPHSPSGNWKTGRERCFFVRPFLKSRFSGRGEFFFRRAKLRPDRPTLNYHLFTQIKISRRVRQIDAKKKYTPNAQTSVSLKSNISRDNKKNC